MKTRGLPGTFAPMYHDRRLAIESRGGDFVDMLDPGVLGGPVGFDRAPYSHCGDAVDDPVDVLFDRSHHIAQDRGAAGPVHDEKVGEPRRHQSHIGARPSRPLLAQPLAIPAAYVDGGQGACHGVEARRQHQVVD